MKKYLLRFSYVEDEFYLYDSLEEMLEDWDCKTLRELLNCSTPFCEYIVYEVCDVCKGE